MIKRKSLFFAVALFVIFAGNVFAKEGEMNIYSDSFSNNSDINVKHANIGIPGGKNLSPNLWWDNAPQGVKSYTLIIIDRHPVANGWIHWMVVDIPAEITSFQEGASNTSKMPKGPKELINGFGSFGYGGPQPPAGTGKHTYEAIVYALDIERTGLNGKVTEKEFLSKVKGHILGQGTLTGFFQRDK